MYPILGTASFFLFLGVGEAAKNLLRNWRLSRSEFGVITVGCGVLKSSLAITPVNVELKTDVSEISSVSIRVDDGQH
jgi:hypothetical protein